MTQMPGCLEIEDFKELVVFMKEQGVENFEYYGLKVNFNAANAISDILSEPASKSAEDIAREEEEILFAST